MSGAHGALPGRADAVRRVLLGLLAANLAVVAVRAAIGLRVGSLAVLGDAVHASVDALNNVLFIALTGYAAKDPDDDHPYGHTKFEVLGALGILVFLVVACFELLQGAVRGLVRGGAAPVFGNADLGLLVFTLAANIWVTRYEARRGRELGSELLLADAAHTRVDVFITVGVLAGALLSRRGVPGVDPVIAIIITGLIARMGWDIFRRATPILVDQVARRPDEVRAAAEGVGGVRSAYDIRSRSASGITFAELTIGVDGALPVSQAHVIADQVEERLKHELQLDRVVVHVEPC